jgi:hypothetical protein
VGVARQSVLAGPYCTTLCAVRGPKRGRRAAFFQAAQGLQRCLSCTNSPSFQPPPAGGRRATRMDGGGRDCHVAGCALALSGRPMWHEVLLALSGYSGDVFVDAATGGRSGVDEEPRLVVAPDVPVEAPEREALNRLVRPQAGVTSSTLPACLAARCTGAAVPSHSLSPFCFSSSRCRWATTAVRWSASWTQSWAGSTSRALACAWTLRLGRAAER